MSQPQLLTNKELLHERIDTLCRVFAVADSTLAGTRVQVQATADGTNNPAAPAWNDGATITFNKDYIVKQAVGITSVEGIVMLNGLNYHELSHIFYTPRMSTALVRQVIAQGLFAEFNALEDQRIETMFTARFKGTIPYFVACVATYFLNDKSLWPHAFPLLHGRRYLDPAIRKAMRDAYMNQANVERIGQIIDEYRMIPSPQRVQEQVLRLLAEYQALTQGATVPGGPFGHGNRGPHETATQGVQRAVDDQAEAIRDAIDAEANGDQGDASNGGDQGDNPQDGIGDQEDVKGDDKAQDGQNGSDDGSEEAGGNQAGTGKGGDHTAANKEVAKRLQEALDSVMNNPVVQREVRDKQRTVVKGDGVTMPKLADRPSTTTAPSATDLNVLRKYTQELKRLEQDLDPGLATHKPSGRINVKRAMQGSPVEEVFDQWTEGKSDATSLEVVILLDYSGSMGGRMMEASTALWINKRAIESLGRTASVTCIGFESNCTMLYRSNERAEANTIRVFTATGGTSPHTGVKEAMRIFHNSKRKNRVLMLITDGGFNDNTDDLIDRCNANGVLTSCVFLGSTYERSEWKEDVYGQSYDAYMDSMKHNCTVFAAMAVTSDLIPFGRELVKQAMRNSR